MIVVNINSIEDHKLSSYILTTFCGYHAGECLIQFSVRTAMPYDCYLFLGPEKLSEILITNVYMSRCFLC